MIVKSFVVMVGCFSLSDYLGATLCSIALCFGICYWYSSNHRMYSSLSWNRNDSTMEDFLGNENEQDPVLRLEQQQTQYTTNSNKYNNKNNPQK
jgi:hypothetical protein